MLNSLPLLLFWEAHEPRHLKKETTVDESRRRWSRINTDRFPKRASKEQASNGVRGRAPSGNFLDFYFLRSAFQGFRVIQTGFQLGKCFFLLLKTYLFWKMWPMYIKRWKPVWIRACLVSWKQQNYYYDTSGEEKTLGKGYQCTAECKI